ncbi:MAG: F0F1 ATP synthase subunit delta [Actinomycetes bacterium]
MHGPSRDSLAAARDRLDEVLAAGGSSQPTDDGLFPADLGADPVAGDLVPADLAVDLFAVVRLLDHEANLRRALTDPALAGQDREALTHTVFSSRVGPAAAEVLAGLARARWSDPGDIADAVEELAVRAELADAQRRDTLDDVEDELFRLARAIDSSAELHAALTEPVRTEADRAELLDGLLADRVDRVTARLAQFAVGHPRGRPLDTVLEGYAGAAARVRRQLVANVVTVVPLTDRQRARMVGLLEQIYDRAVHLDVQVDPSVVGGVRVQVGDEVIDATIAQRLREARRRLAS